MDKTQSTFVLYFTFTFLSFFFSNMLKSRMQMVSYNYKLHDESLGIVKEKKLRSLMKK